MAAYAYPIVINYGREKIAKEHVQRIFQGLKMSLDDLKKIVGDNVFSLDYEHDSQYIIIEWNTYRDETDEEQAARIAKEEAYMLEYSKRKEVKK
jgi:hypothetical protein